MEFFSNIIINNNITKVENTLKINVINFSSNKKLCPKNQQVLLLFGRTIHVLSFKIRRQPFPYLTCRNLRSEKIPLEMPVIE